MSDIISEFPDPLLDDLVEGRWLPVVGAGFSRNASTPTDKEMPDWDELGRQLGDDIPGPDYPYSTPLDAASAYEHEFSRTRLVECISNLLLIDEASPGVAHKAFCQLPFDLVLTTNLEFLLENQYRSLQKYCEPVVAENQLPIRTSSSAVKLLKLHGDIHHPHRMIITEDDYDTFLNDYPMWATYISSLLISRTPVLIGYSLDDPDFRQLWQLVANRLGPSRRSAYALMVDPERHQTARYERRGVSVVAVPGDRSQYGETLASTFRDLKTLWTQRALSPTSVTEEDSLRELALPSDSPSRLCYFSVPFTLQSFYREYVFPVARDYGLVPISRIDISSSGFNTAAKIEALIERSYAVVVDAATSATRHELGIALDRGMSNRTVVLVDEEQPSSVELRNIKRIRRPTDPFSNPDAVIDDLRQWFQKKSDRVMNSLRREPQRLLERNEYRAAVISAMTLLETELKRALGKPSDTDEAHMLPFSKMVRLAKMEELLRPDQRHDVKEWRMIRNQAVHSAQQVDREVAQAIVAGVDELVEQLAQ